MLNELTVQKDSKIVELGEKLNRLEREQVKADAQALVEQETIREVRDRIPLKNYLLV